LSVSSTKDHLAAGPLGSFPRLSSWISGVRARKRKREEGGRIYKGVRIGTVEDRKCGYGRIGE